MYNTNHPGCIQAFNKLLFQTNIESDTIVSMSKPFKIPRGAILLSYYNFGAHPFTISLSALGISYSAQSGGEGYGDVKLLSEHDTTTPLRIYCPSKDCNGSVYVFYEKMDLPEPLTRPRRRRRIPAETKINDYFC